MPKTEDATCILINGLPGSGKTTYARRLVARRPGWFNLDVDVLRSLLGIATIDFAEAGLEVRPLAMSLLKTQLALGRNVVFPQLFFGPDESMDFEEAARTSGAVVTRFMITVPIEECWRRVRDRGRGGSPFRLGGV